MGASVLLVTHDRSTIGRLSCNPAVGGMAKGQLACEIDALGGEMARIADEAGIQFKTLGTRKGPAMWSPRAQCDKERYPETARTRLERRENLEILEEGVADVRVKDGAVVGVETESGKTISARTVVLCAGTFLCGTMHAGEMTTYGGRVGEKSANAVSGSLRSIGFETGRLKTGTPPRLVTETIDFTRCREDDGDIDPRPFSERTDRVSNAITCFTTRTNERTHAILEAAFERSPMFTGQIEGTGPRYCPSVEDKVARFRERTGHSLFLEPETTEGSTTYVNGFSTSMPRAVQEAAIRSITGLEKAEISQFGYAVEYDYFPPHQLHPSLMSRRVKGLFFAGQVNGTSGYEEAAAQGLMAGINAVRWCDNNEPFILDRSTSYIGVLLDDLARLGTDEPYRLFTSRAEYRLLLRRDNADLRLGVFGEDLGLVDAAMATRRREVEQLSDRLEMAARKVTLCTNEENQGESGNSKLIVDLLKRPDARLADFAELRGTTDDVSMLREALDEIQSPRRKPGQQRSIVERGFEQLQISQRYGGYIERQEREIVQFKAEEAKLIPRTIDYDAISSISSEGREKLARYRPASLGQAARIAGVSRSDVAVLMLYIH